jgi:hypothetical protein
MKAGRKNKGLSEVIVNFTCSKADRDLMHEAASFDKRSLADFIRVYTLRVANQLMAQKKGIDILNQVGGFLGTQNMHPDLFSDDGGGKDARRK